MKLDFTHGAILIAAAIAFILGIEWLFAALGVLFVALIFVEYYSQPAPKAMRVPPPAPAPQGAQPQVFVQASSPTDFVSDYLSNALSEVYVGKDSKEYADKKAYFKTDVAALKVKEAVEGETKALKKEIDSLRADLKKAVSEKDKSDKGK